MVVRESSFAVVAVALLAACSGAGTSSKGEVTTCQPGDTLLRACGNCGSMSRTCDLGQWTDWSGCLGQKECAAGTTDTASCGSSVGACRAGTVSRTCSGACEWSTWGACTGAIGPTAEVCGNGADENCNGVSDEGCACHPATQGAGSAFALAGEISKLTADPARCFVYALDTGSPSSVVVIDTDQKKELTRIPLPQIATDFGLSPDGAHMVVAHDAVHQLSIIDLGTFAVSSTIPVQSDPYAVEVNDQGVAYYAELDQWVDLRAVNLDTGVDTLLAGAWPLYEADLELSHDGSLYAGEAHLSGSVLKHYVPSGSGMALVDHSTWDDGYGFPYPARHLYLSPGGQHVHYAGYELDAAHLALVLGATGELVFAEDAAGTFAVGQAHVFDAQLVRPVATLPAAVDAAALASADTELWTYSASHGQVAYRNVAELVDAGSLGQRAVEPEPLAAYAITGLAADPVRARLYALDASRSLVVAVDAGTLTPLGALVVGSDPSDLDVSPDGDALYVGHMGTLAIARIDLATFAFEQFIPTPRLSFDIEVLTPSRLVTIDDDQWTTPTLMDSATGQVLDWSSWGAYEGALSATGDGKSLFVGEAYLSGSAITRYDVSGDELVPTTKSTYDDGYGFPYPERSVVAVPDGSGVYYAGYLLDGNDLAILRYAQADRIRSVTPDGRLATSSTKVYRVADGTALGSLPTTGALQAVSPDGKTLYVVTVGGIAKVDLSAF